MFQRVIKADKELAKPELPCNGRLTLLLVAVLGAVFLRGFTEAIGLAVVLVIGYLGLNCVVIGVSLATGS